MGVLFMQKSKQRVGTMKTKILLIIILVLIASVITVSIGPANGLLVSVILNKPANDSLILESDMPITLNFSVTSQESEIKNCSLWGNFNGIWELNQSIYSNYIYQENADAQSSTGNWWIDGGRAADGNWAGGDSADTGETAYWSLNYTKPEGVFQALWQIKNDAEIGYGHNETVPAQCWDAYSDIIMMKAESIYFGLVGKWSCHNNAEWVTIYEQSGSHEYILKEEAIWWNFTIANNTITNFDPISLSDGSYVWNVQCYDNDGNSDWGDANNTFTVTNPVYTIQNPSLDNVAYFGSGGNLILAGNCISGGACSAPDGSYVFQDSEGNEVAHVDNSGNLCIEYGDCSDNSLSCNPSNSAFIIQDSLGNNVSYIDLTNGDLCLTGDLIEYGNP